MERMPRMQQKQYIVTTVLLKANDCMQRCSMQEAQTVLAVQDMYRRLSSPLAVEGMLRMRTSPEFKVSRAYGQLFQDEQYDNLAHITGCSPHSTFAFDFRFTSAGGFATTPDSPPMLQMVFQYSLLVAKTAPQVKPVQQQSNGDGPAKAPPQPKTQ